MKKILSVLMVMLISTNLSAFAGTTIGTANNKYASKTVGVLVAITQKTMK